MGLLQTSMVGMPTDEMAHTRTGHLTAAVVEVDVSATVMAAVRADSLAGQEMVGMPTTTDHQETATDKIVDLVVADAMRNTEAGRDTTTTLATTIPGSEDISRCLIVTVCWVGLHPISALPIRLSSCRVRVSQRPHLFTAAIVIFAGVLCQTPHLHELSTPNLYLVG